MTKNKRTLRQIFELQCQICKSMAHAVRLEIVDLLSQKERTASFLIAELETSKANLSKHMAVLIQAGIVGQRRHGRQVSYFLPHPEIHHACSIMRSILYQRLKRGEKLADAMKP